MADEDIDFSSRAKSTKGQVVPAVYFFEPAYHVVLENDELTLWERLLEEKVGLTKQDIERLERDGIRAQRTMSMCGSWYYSEGCDCDQVQQ